MSVSILITGASGYIGSRLVVRAKRFGFQVIAAVRPGAGRASLADTEVRHFDLTEPLDPSLMDGVGAVIHLAAVIREDSQPPGATEDFNVTGTRRLLRLARERRVARFLFVSSQSAAPHAPTKYGRSKWQIERLLTEPGEIVIQPGMVTGGAPHGVYGTLVKLCRRWPILPLVNGGAPVYPVHIDDLCDGMLEIVGGVVPERGTVRFTPPAVVPFSQYVHMLASLRAGCAVATLPVPVGPLLGMNRMIAKLRGWPLVSEERLQGLAALQVPSPRPQEHVITVPSAAEHLALEGRRRRLLVEGRTLFRYILGQRLSSMAVRHYVRAILREEDPSPLRLPRAFVVWPTLLRCVEPVTGSQNVRLRRRLRAAMRIIEMTPQAAPVFHNYDRTPWFIAATRIVAVSLAELLLLPVRYLAADYSRY